MYKQKLARLKTDDRSFIGRLWLWSLPEDSCFHTGGGISSPQAKVLREGLKLFLKELVKAFMRPENRHSYDFGPFRLDTKKRRLLLAGEIVSLTPKAVETLVMLVERQGKLVEREELMNTVWHDAFVEDSNLSVTISMLRKALGQGAEGVGSKYIETVPRLGYRFVADVHDVTGEGPVIAVEKRTQGQIVIEETADDSEESAIIPTRKDLSLREGKWLTARNITLVLLCAIAIGGSALALRKLTGTKPGAPSFKSIAVLPLRHFGHETDDQDLRFRITDSLITKFGELRGIVVRPTSSVLRYADNTKDAISVGRELHVDAVIEGTVQNEGKRLRVTLQLINVNQGASIWSGQFDGQVDQLLALQDQISSHIAQNWPLGLSDSERTQFAKRPTNNPEAYEAYLKGRYSSEKRTFEGLTKGIAHFEQAIAKDPEYALAYAGLADCYSLLGDYGYQPPTKTFPKAREAALKALAIDNALAEAHTSLGFVRASFDWDWAGAEAEYRKAIELNPNYVPAHHWYALLLAALGRHSEAVAEMEQAQSLDPVSVVIATNLGRIFYLGRQYDRAMQNFQKANELDSNFNGLHLKMGQTYAAQKMYAEAVAEYQKEMMRWDRDLAETMRQAFASGGYTSVNRVWLEEFEKLSRQFYVEPYFIASKALLSGDKELALKSLEVAFEERSPWLMYLKVEPEMDDLRSEMRFKELLSKLNLVDK
jgi:DNA-binding winged helix-turn-helix (wHTH) protein/TolB-like protein/Tfp pilus assembly protein PilF